MNDLRFPFHQVLKNAGVTAVAVLVLASTGCKSVPVQSKERGLDQPEPPGRMRDLGGYRLHALQQGRRGPAVVFIAGAGDGSMHWSLVQPEVARFARTVSFDRAGFAWSAAGPTPRTLLQEAYELRQLLERLRVQPPFVLVGHSLGGPVARIFAREYLNEVAGVVLVDATDADTTLIIRNQENGQWLNKLVRVRDAAKNRSVPPPQTMASSPPAPPTAEDREQFEQFKKLVGTPKLEPPFDRLPGWAQTAYLWARANPKLQHDTDNYFAEELAGIYAQERRDPQPLRDLPLIVLTGRAAVGDPPSGISAEDWASAMTEKQRQKERMAKLSRNSRFVRDDRSGHHIQLENPALVVAAVKAVVTAARTRGRLTETSLMSSP
jgi:pimeloyl-ACP methyl ester carboxylesterase